MTKTVLIHLCVGACLLACRPEKPSADADNQSVQTQKEDVTVVGEKEPAEKAVQPQVAAPAVTEEIPISTETVLPGTSITKNGEPVKLSGTPLEVGKPLPEMQLKNAVSGEMISTSSLRGKVLLISVIPAVETQTCSAQCRYLEEKGQHMGDNIIRITISRDEAERLQKFAKSEESSTVMYLTDREKGAFGVGTGLEMADQNILARSVIVVDSTGIVRHIQVVPEVTQLPDMDNAFQLALDLTTNAAAPAKSIGAPAAQAKEAANQE
ncbi:MAG: redoxin family protein [Deltaproteobacteria bacterium]|nr:redoxin family protein [Deltaproteobacteria bacterium]MBN2671267.1 redoxin family protein [Deltaproteobacteria bacterium]